MVSISQTVPSPIERASFLLPAEVETPTPAGERTNETQTLAASDDNFQKTVDIIGTSGVENTPKRSANSSHGSPFSVFFADLRQSGDVVESKEPPAVDNEASDELPQQSSSYATNLDLLALERRIRLMVTETTTAINSKLMETLPQPPIGPSDNDPEPEARGATGGSLAARVTLGTSDGASLFTQGRKKLRRNPIRVKRRESQPASSDDRSGTQKRPRPRIHLNIQMYRKHPVFKFFVTAPADADRDPHKWRCRVCHTELSLKTKDSLEILSHYRTDAHLVREHRIKMATPGLPLYGRDEMELVGPPLDEAREKAELIFPIAPILGECYLLPGQRELPVDTDILDPSAVICSQVRILLAGLQYGGESEVLTSLWANLSLEVRGPTKVPQFNWNPERVFVSVFNF